MDSRFSIAVHALVYLNHMNRVLTSEKLARNICTNPARVRKVMAELKKAGLIETKEGNEGGYWFALDANEVTLARVAAALDIKFVDAAWHSGDSDMECLVASGMAAIMDTIFARLNENCNEVLSGITIGDINRKIFGKNEEAAT